VILIEFVRERPMLGILDAAFDDAHKSRISGRDIAAAWLTVLLVCSALLLVLLR
jgi:hypothetical protein